LGAPERAKKPAARRYSEGSDTKRKKQTTEVMPPPAQREMRGDFVMDITPHVALMRSLSNARPCSFPSAINGKERSGWQFFEH
jgi:hypothetical protein